MTDATEKLAATYVGRFAPSPTGPLHAGSLVAALASWLDARAAHGGSGGRWLVRIEDVDTPRCSPEAAEMILLQLAACGLVPDEPPVYQSQLGPRYERALAQWMGSSNPTEPHWAYPCGCTRRDIEQASASTGHAHQRHTEHVYPGTCRDGLHGKPARAWRFNTTAFQAGLPIDPLNAAATVARPVCTSQGVRWTDRRMGMQSQNVAAQVGDFVLRRADGIWAYQLAVVADDAAQGITHIVRGEDLADNTPRQILLQAALGWPTPHYLHTPLIRDASGEKLSKQHGAPAIDILQPLLALCDAAEALGLPVPAHLRQGQVPDALAYWIRAWTHPID